MLIAAAVMAILVYGMIAAMLGTILPDLSKRFNLTPKQNGSIAFAQALGLIIASISVGPLIDYQGKKIALVLGLALVCLALFLLPRSRGYSNIAAYLFLIGFGGGIIVTGANALVGDIDPNQRAATSNFLNLFFGLGGLLTPFISANLLGRDSSKLTYVILAVTGTTLALNAIAPMPLAAGVSSQDVSSMGALFGNPTLWMLCLFLFLYVAAEVGVWNWLTQHLIAQGVPESRALNILSLGFALGLLIGRVAVAPLFATIPAAYVTLAASACMAITTFLVLRVPSAAGILVFLAGVSMAPVFPTTLAIAGDRFQGSATALGIVITCGWIGLAVSSRVIGGIAGGDPRRLRTALLVLPVAAMLMFVVNFAFL